MNLRETEWQCLLHGTVFLCISDRICSLLHTCSVCFVIIKKLFCMSLQATYFFVGIRVALPIFFRAWGNIIHFQNELKKPWQYATTWLTPEKVPATSPEACVFEAVVARGGEGGQSYTNPLKEKL